MEKYKGEGRKEKKEWNCEKRMTQKNKGKKEHIFNKYSYG